MRLSVRPEILVSLPKLQQHFQTFLLVVHKIDELLHELAITKKVGDEGCNLGVLGKILCDSATITS